MSAAFAEACRRPFSNGTEGAAWMAKWCECCARDHPMHHVKDDLGNWQTAGDPGEACTLILTTMIGDDWPEGWLPEPDDGQFSLPSRLVCTAFTPCVPCGGDPAPEERAALVEAVSMYWRDRR
jgi:hypothetical protein